MANDVEPALARYRSIVKDWPAFRESPGRPLPIGVWANPLRTDRAALRGHLSALGIESTPTPWHPHGVSLPAESRPGMSWPYLAGLCHIQEEVATAASLLLDPRKGERLLDLCSAPGNKTAQLATALDGRGTVVARELEIGRIPALRNAIERLGLLNVATSPGDGSDPEFLAGIIGSFDAVLADVPCTSEGTSRKNKRILRRCGRWISERMSGAQTRLLRSAVAACRPGGRVVYATCTYAPEENEAVVNAVLEEAGATVRLRPARLDGLACSPGITSWEGTAYDPQLNNAMRIWPHQNDTGGFFIAVIDVLSPPPWAADVEKEGQRLTTRRTASAAVEGSMETPAPVETSTADDTQVYTSSSALPPEDDPTTPVLGLPAHDHPAISSVAQHFGFPSDAFEGLRFVKRNRRGLHAVASDHEPPASSAPDCVGIFFVRVDGRVPKLSTAGALAFGALATRQTIELDAEGTVAFLARQDIDVPADALGSVEARGYVIARHLGHPLGVGWIDEPGQDGVRLTSQFPKGWSHSVAG